MSEAKRLDDYRIDRLQSVDEFAESLGVTIRTLYRIREGKEVRLPTMKKITTALKVKPDQVTEFAAQLARMRGQPAGSSS